MKDIEDRVKILEKKVSKLEENRKIKRVISVITIILTVIIVLIYIFYYVNMQNNVDKMFNI